ncbi:MAG: META domain-containing protein [Ginsengibacter sp.]
MKNIFLVVLLAVILFNCRSARPVTTPAVIEPAPEIAVEKTPGIKLNGKWELEKLWGSSNKWNVSPDININFDDKTFTGNTGCNSMSGKFTIKDNFISINKEIITTEMACAGYDERLFLSVLLKINRYVVDNNVLELSQDDIVLMRFINH